MGLLDNQNQLSYYPDNFGGSGQGDLGSYQFVTMDNIINAFLLVYVGEDKIINKVSRTDVQFHAMRAIQELSYDVFRSIKSQEIEVPPALVMPLPQDYVNYVKIVRVGSDGIERVLYPTGKTSNPFAITQGANGVYEFTDNSLTEQTSSDTLQNYQGNGTPDPDTADSFDIELDNLGRRYGLDPQHAQSNGTFFIDYLRGFIHFSSHLVGETITLKYISDGLGTDHEMVVHKFCEEACYKHIMYSVIASRSNIPEYIIQRYKKEKFAETRKAKIRLSNIKIEEFTQIVKGMGKQIKQYYARN